jgi:hypothetical protein
MKRTLTSTSSRRIGARQMAVKASETTCGGRFSGSRNRCLISGDLSYEISSDFFTFFVSVGGSLRVTSA